MGEKTLHSHADGKKHKKRLEDHEQVKISLSQKMQQTLPKNPSKTSESVVIATPVDSVSVIGSTSSNASHTKSLDACFPD